MGVVDPVNENNKPSTKEHLLQEYANLPEILGGLSGIVEETEDYTCLTLKSIMGRREKGYGDSTLFSPSQSTATNGDRKPKEMV